MSFVQIILLTAFLLGTAVIIVSGWLFIYRLKNRSQLTHALNMSLFLISLPKKTKTAQAEGGDGHRDRREIIGVMEQLYSSLANLKEAGRGLFGVRPYLVFEIATPHLGEEIAVYLAAPRHYQAILEKQIHGFYPEASIERVEDYNIFHPKGVAAGAYLKLAKHYILPLKTYQDLEADPLNEIINTLSKFDEKGEGAAVQIVFRPTALKWQKLAVGVAQEMQAGKSFSKALSEKSSWLLRFFREVFKGVKTADKDGSSAAKEKESLITPGQEELIKAVEGKSRKAGFDVNVRLLVSASQSERAREMLKHLEAAFVQFNAPHLNQLKVVQLKKGRGLKRLIYDFSFRIFNNKQKMLLNTEELTSLFHFPTSAVETPKVKFLKAKPAAPPANLPKQGIILGRNVYRDVETVVRLQKDDRRRHLYIIGQTGTGKSAFLNNMIVQDIENREGVAVLDPHGDLIEAVLRLIPKERAEEVILLDPADLERPLGLNMLEYDSQYPEQKTFVVNELINIFDKLYDLRQTGGPMFEQYTRNALLLLMDDPNEKFTLMEVPKVLADKEFRARLLAKCQNIVVKDFWEKEAEKAGGEAALVNMVPYITSKFNVFVANDYMRPIIGQAVSAFNFRRVLDEQKILLVNLSKGRLGEGNSSLLGLIVVGKLLMAAFSRIDLTEEKRRDFYLYMDEFQNFATDSIATILSEARKYRLCLILAHQFIGQLDERIRAAVFGNVGSMVSFRVGAEDAEFLVKQFEPVFDINDLINIDNFNAYIKLMVNNETTKPFNLLTYPPKKGDSETAQAIKELSRLKYGRAQSEVEQEIRQRWQSSLFTKSDQPLAYPDTEIK